MADHTDFRSDFSSSDDSDEDSTSEDDIGYDIGKKTPTKSKPKVLTKPPPSKQQLAKPPASKPVAIKSPPIRHQPPEKYKISSVKASGSSLYDEVSLVCNEDVLYIEEEKVIFLTTDKNSKIYLPKLDSESPSKTSKGSLYVSKKIKIKATRLGYEHNIFSYGGNFINAGSTVYNLKGGKYVTFYGAGSIWYTMD